MVPEVKSWTEMAEMVRRAQMDSTEPETAIHLNWHPLHAKVRRLEVEPREREARMESRQIQLESQLELHQTNLRE